MKCIYCGNELKEGSLFCPYCGKEVQIVPDYNIYDDDYLKAVLAQENADTDAFADVNGTKAVNKASSENGKKKPKNSKTEDYYCKCNRCYCSACYRTHFGRHEYS